MKICELARRKKPVPPPYDPVEDARSYLESEKESGLRARPNGTLQLFVPRTIERYDTRKERKDHVLRDRAKYAYDDEGEMIPQFKDWVNSANESLLREGPPIIASGWQPKAGGFKPYDSLLWTSTAQKLPSGKWTSKWNEFIQSGNVSGKPHKIGYVYKVRPNTSVLELDSYQDAERIYDIFAKLGRPNTALTDPAEWEKYRDNRFWDKPSVQIIKKDFPWGNIAQNFDCVHHWPRRSYGGERDPFFTGWDIESTVWFKPNQLELLGQVPLWTEADRNDDEDDDY